MEESFVTDLYNYSPAGASQLLFVLSVQDLESSGINADFDASLRFRFSVSTPIYIVLSYICCLLHFPIFVSIHVHVLKYLTYRLLEMVQISLLSWESEC